MKANITDVAKQALVSIKTVSRVLNNEVYVRQTTRDKVMKAIELLNYTPNLSARHLASAKDYSIAFIYDSTNTHYIVGMQNGILAASKQQGYELLIHPCNAKSENIVEEITHMVRTSRVAGLILTPPFSGMPKFVQKMTNLGVDVVRIMSGDTAPDNIASCVMVNDFKASADITQYLINLGHTNIAFIGAQADDMSAVERLKGYKQALADSSIQLDASLIIDGEYSFDAGVRGTKSLMTGTTKPTAIFSCNDEIAAGAVFAARLMGISIPEKLSITGFENSPFSNQTWPRITTANQPIQKIAEDATHLLIARIKKQTTENTIVQYTPQLIIGDSTGQVS